MNRVETTQTIVSYAISNVYGYMFRGLVLSTIMALLFAYVPEFQSFIYNTNEAGQISFSIPGLIILVAPLVMIFCEGWAAKQGSHVMLMFFSLFAMAMGVTLSSIFLVYSVGNIISAFAVTTLTFGAMSLIGYTTKKDLSGVGSFLIMALIGVIIASISNWFFKSTMMDFVINIIALVVFIGLTAYDTQKVKKELANVEDREFAKVVAIRGALSLYLNFINMLLIILRLGKK